MALRRAQQAGHEICALLTMFSPENGTSRSHGLPRGVLADQANVLARFAGQTLTSLLVSFSLVCGGDVEATCQQDLVRTSHGERGDESKVHLLADF